MKSLFQLYRPKTWEHFVGHDRVKACIMRMINRGSLGGRAFWITGSSGTGKTTLGNLIATEVSDEDNIIELDSGELTPKGIDDIERLVRCRAIGDKSGRAVMKWQLQLAGLARKRKSR